MAKHVVIETRDEWERRKTTERRKARKNDPYIIASIGIISIILGISMNVWANTSDVMDTIRIAIIVFGLIFIFIGYLDYKLQRRR